MGWDEDRIRRDIANKQEIANALQNNLASYKPADKATAQSTINGLNQQISGMRSELTNRDTK